MKNFVNAIRMKKLSDNNVVYTSNRVVNEILDLNINEFINVDSKCLEQACGTGNFLECILSRKFSSIKKKKALSRIDFQFYVLRAIMSIYGIEIDPKAVCQCIERLLFVTKSFCKEFLSEEQWSSFENIVRYVLEINIICGNALTMKTPIDGNPIVIAEWSLLGGYRIKRKDYIYSQIVEQSKGLMAKAIRDYPITNIFKIKETYAV